MVSIGRCFGQGMDNLKANFWPLLLIVVILGMVDSFGSGPVWWQDPSDTLEFGFGVARKGFLALIVGVFVKPVFDFGARLQFVRGHRGEEIEVFEIVQGFNSKQFYIDIILANLMVVVLIIAGTICLVLPGLYIFSRVVLTSYLVMDKDLAPKQALHASWELTRDFWPSTLLLGLLSILVMIGGLCLLVIGIIPALVWVKAAFAAYYQQILDAHNEEFLRSLDIEP